MLRIAGRLPKPILLLLIMTIGVLGASCGAKPDLRQVAPDYIAQVPDPEAEAIVMAHIELPPTLAAQDAPRFEISFDNVHRCHGRDFITFRVTNAGEVPYFWASEWLIYRWRAGEFEQHAMSRYDIQKPFLPRPGSCPRARGNIDRLEPGETAYVGVYLTFDFDEVELARFGERSWGDITNVTYYVELNTTAFPISSINHPMIIDITSEVDGCSDTLWEFSRQPTLELAPEFTVEARTAEPIPLPTRNPLATIPPGTASLPTPMPPRP